jgi:hypothetical protein
MIDETRKRRGLVDLAPGREPLGLRERLASVPRSGRIEGTMIEPPTRIHLEIELPRDRAGLLLPEGVDRRMQALLDKQDRGEPLTDDEAAEAEGIVELSDLLSLMRLRASGAGSAAPA